MENIFVLHDTTINEMVELFLLFELNFLKKSGKYFDLMLLQKHLLKRVGMVAEALQYL